MLLGLRPKPWWGVVPIDIGRDCHQQIIGNLYPSAKEGGRDRKQQAGREGTAATRRGSDRPKTAPTRRRRPAHRRLFGSGRV